MTSIPYHIQMQGSVSTEAEINNLQKQFTNIIHGLRVQLASKSNLQERREKLISLFMFEPPAPGKYFLSYEYRKSYSSYSQDKPILTQLMREGLVKIVHKDSKTKTFQYIPKAA